VTPESQLWKSLKKANPKMFMQRIENSLSSGMPDVYFVNDFTGLAGMCELKVSRGKRKLVMKYPTHQRLWARKHMESGGDHLLVVKHLKDVLWFKGLAVLTPETSEPFYVGLDWPGIH
jgi:hypothetical protein